MRCSTCDTVLNLNVKCLDCKWLSEIFYSNTFFMSKDITETEGFCNVVSDPCRDGELCDLLEFFISMFISSFWLFIATLHSRLQWLSHKEFTLVKIFVFYSFIDFKSIMKHKPWNQSNAIFSALLHATRKSHIFEV